MHDRLNSYLSLARQALLRAKRPLTPQQMLEFAKSEGFLPPHLTGATMHKTMMARLSEHIREQSATSAFYRTSPGTFFLHEIASDASTPDEYRNVYVGHLRSKSIRKENVLVAPRADLSRSIKGEFVPYNENTFRELYRTYCVFVDRSLAEVDDSVKQFVTFTLIFHDHKILTYRRGKFTTASDTLKGQLSIGFGGHVNDKDFTLFSLGGDAFRANAVRELREELFLDDLYRDVDEAAKRIELMGYVNVDGDNDAEHHIAVLVAFNHMTSDLPRKGELSINQLGWLDLSVRKNDFSGFDYWSEIILRNIFDGLIPIPGMEK